MEEKEVFLELILSKSIETDANGNYIIWAEASNENLDYEEQQVLQRALLESKDYFLQNGLVSYDHRHLKPVPGEKDWNSEKYIIGEPLEVKKSGDKTFVKALLYKSNKIVQEIISKLKDGSKLVKTSIAGKKPVIKKVFDNKLRKFVEKVVSVAWDELALTYKPVNQTLMPASLSSKGFVKSLQAGYETDAAKMTGGQALIPEDLEGGKDKKNITAVVMALTFGDIKTVDEARQFLKNRGYSEEDTDQILKLIVQKKNFVKKGVNIMGDETLEKAFDESIEELEKAMKGEKKKEEEPTIPPEIPPETPPLSPEEEEEKKKKEEEERLKKTAKKSLLEKVEEEEEELLDVSKFLKSFVKSMSDKFEALEKRFDAQEQKNEAIGKALGATMKFTKSLGDKPEARKSVLKKSERKFLGDDGKEVVMGRQEILKKAGLALEKGKITLRKHSILEDRLNKGIAIADEDLRILKSID